MKQKIADLVYLSQKIGQRLDYVQGGGGNISVKISENLMAIKASGYELKNLTYEDGFAFVNQKQVNQGISDFSDNKNGDDGKFSVVIKSATKSLENYPNLRPSMETGFHSLLPFTYVVHSHSLYAGILNCSQQGEEIAKKLFPDMLWIGYENPGWQVTEAIYLAIKKNKKFAQIIFLQNHGLIVASNDVNQGLELHEMVTKEIQNFLQIPEFKLSEIQNFSTSFMRQNVLFPDQIVFGISEEFDESEVPNKIKGHIFAAYSYILRSLAQSALEPVFIAQKNIDFVTNMESEKYRKEVAKK
jgi:rhamnose utilization protein RhaD (predicted bifunctional aldolase and dehydrogenase)